MTFEFTILAVSLTINYFEGNRSSDSGRLGWRRETRGLQGPRHTRQCVAQTVVGSLPSSQYHYYAGRGGPVAGSNGPTPNFGGRRRDVFIRSAA